MKNSKEYTKKIISLYQALKRKSTKTSASNHAGGTSENHRQVVDSIIYGIICEKLNEKDTEAAMKRFSEYFVDWNDLRVSKPEEIAEMLGADTPDNRQAALTITKVLQRIFNENHQISLESLQKLGKRQARQKLEKMEELSRFVIDYCMLTSLSSHAIPLTERMIVYLKTNDLVDKNADAETIEGFLSKQISAKNGYEFYELLRHESETQNASGAVTAEQAVSHSVSGQASPEKSVEKKKRHAVKKKTETKKAAKKSVPRSTAKKAKTKKKTKK